MNKHGAQFLQTVTWGEPPKLIFDLNFSHRTNARRWMEREAVMICSMVRAHFERVARTAPEELQDQALAESDRWDITDGRAAVSAVRSLPVYEALGREVPIR